MSKNDVHSQLAGNKRLRRRWITWTRMLRYGVNNFTRNMWLTTAATAVMTITLLIIFSTYVTRTVLTDTVADIRQKVDIPINLKSSTTEEEALDLKAKFEEQSSVSSVAYISKEVSKQKFITEHQPSAAELDVVASLPEQPYYPILKIVPKDPTDTSDLEKFVNGNADVQAALSTDSRLKPSFSGQRAKNIATISSWANTAEKVGLFAGIIFVAISMLIIFNTIRMAIFSRKDEIEMMKLIGADKSFIRGPFVVEAVMYGFFAALAATAVGVFLFLQVEPRLTAYGIATSTLHESLVQYSPVLLICMIVIGSIIGIISARLAVRRYLRLS